MQGYHIYDQPPSVYSERSANYPPPAYSATVPSTSGMGPRRKSWQDLVSESDTGTVSDLSILNTSIGFGAPNGAMGSRRTSWLNLMNSDDSLVKHNGLAKVSTNPAGPPPPKPKRLKLFSLNEKGKLKEEKQRQSQNTSTASTPSEFILVAKSSGATRLPLKSPIPEGSQPDFGSFNHQPQQSQQENETKVKFPLRCLTSKKTLLALGGAVLLFGLALLIGLVARNALQWPKTYRYEWYPGVKTLSLVNVVLKRNNQANFRVDGQWPFQTIKTVVDFETKRVVVIDLSLPNYCFASVLNETALPNMDTLVTAADNAQTTDGEVGEWPQYWHWSVEPLSSEWKNQIVSSKIEECTSASSIHLLQPVQRDTLTEKCIDCSQVCVPHYTTSEGTEPLLEIGRQDCFWFYAKEWAEFAAASRDRGYNGNRWPEPSIARPTAPWVRMESKADQNIVDLVQPESQGRELRPPPATQAPMVDENGWFIMPQNTQK